MVNFFLLEFLCKVVQLRHFLKNLFSLFVSLKFLNKMSRIFILYWTILPLICEFNLRSSYYAYKFNLFNFSYLRYASINAYPRNPWRRACCHGSLALAALAQGLSAGIKALGKCCESLSEYGNYPSTVCFRSNTSFQACCALLKELKGYKPTYFSPALFYNIFSYFLKIFQFFAITFYFCIEFSLISREKMSTRAHEK